MRKIIPALLLAAILCGQPARAGEDVTTGRIVAIDAVSGEVTLKHGPILGMPGMTMAFPLADRKLGRALHVGQQVEFQLKPRPDGEFAIVRITPVAPEPPK